MQSVAIISKNVTRKTPAAIRIDFPEWKRLADIRHHIEKTDWTNGHLMGQGLDSLCRYLLIAALTCFLIPIGLTLVR